MMIAEIDASKINLWGLIKAVDELRKYDATMELSQLLVFLHVAARPGIRVPDLLPLTGLSRSALSRNILALSEKHYLTDKEGKNRPGHDLITTVSDPFDSRSQLAAPTRRGVMLAQKLLSLACNGGPNGAEARN